MSDLNTLIESVGNWTGNNRLHNPMTNQLEDSLSSANFTAILKNQFIQLTYTWQFENTPQEGMMLIGQQKENKQVSLHWIDSWHMGDQVMACHGKFVKDNHISVKGAYQVPDHPPWGWRIDIELQNNQAIQVNMFNISPKGEEAIAVEISLESSK